MSPEDRLRELKDPERWMNVRVPKAPARARGRKRRASGRAIEVVVAFAIAILAVIGITAALELVAGHRPVPPAATSSTSPPTAAPSPSVRAVPSFTAVAGVSHRYSASVHPATCTLAHVQSDSAQDGGGAAGTYVQTIFVRNAGADCFLPSDAVRVGGEIAALGSGSATDGLVLPSGASGTLRVGATFLCQPSGATNIDPSRPALSIALQMAGGSRTMTAKYPRPQCTAPSVDGELGVAEGTRFASSPSGLDATIPQSVVSGPGPVDYTVTLQNNGRAALVLTSCPIATEVLIDGARTVLTRAITLRCTIGATMQPQVPVSVAASTTVPIKGDWTISWYLAGGSRTTAISTTCTLSQLSVAEPEAAGGAAGNWVQMISVRDRGGDCTLPVTAFSAGGWVARAETANDAAGIPLTAGSTAHVIFGAGTTCLDGTMNITSIRSLGQTDKPVVLSLGGADAAGLTRPFPELHCANPYVGRLR